MCGFIGGTEAGWNYAAALATLEHRGPDAGRLRLEGPIRVGFRRLAIIDLDDAANQPMLAHDGESWVVFNGEIYGFKRLRTALEKRGRTFRTHSDTEVVLNAYFEWGERFVDRIDGMFAIAIWDAAERRLKLYRDRPGIKPLYYYHRGSSFAFSSELKGIECAVDRSQLEVDGSALYDFLGYRYVPAPKTLYRYCYKLPPAHWMAFDPDTGRTSGPSAYWHLEVPMDPRPDGVDGSTERLRELIRDSVCDQTIADVPLGFFLSGGVDSSVVVAAAAGEGTRVSTFSIGFDSDDASETPYARQVAELFGTDHHERTLSRKHAQALLPNLRRWFDEPFADESAMPTYFVCEMARERVKVVLTGDGGDEVFGGYRTYRRHARYARIPSWPRFMDDICFRLRKPFGKRHAVTRLLTLLELAFSTGPALWAKIMSGMPEPAKREYRAMFELPADYDDWWHYRDHWRNELPVRTRLQYLDFHTFMPGLVLAKVDRTSMAVSLEARVPLLAKEIIEFSFSLEECVRYYGNEPKGLLRQAYRGVLPDEILDRRKKGFGIPRYYLRELDGGIPVQELVLQKLFLS